MEKSVRPRSALALALAFALALAPLWLTVPVSAENLREAADRSGSFKTFLSAAKTAGLIGELESRPPLTLFLPTDTAFAQLPDGEWETVSRDRKRLAQVLRYHMVKGQMKVTEVKPGLTRSLSGDELMLKSDNGMVTVNGARVTESDLQADNGIIHGIDQVLMPPE
jgi:uncharacterized surface protein with fasciclin (FAS1) repeats